MVDWFGPTDFFAIAAEHGNVDDPDLMTARLVGGPLLEQRELVELANPALHVTPNAAPFLIMHGARDRLVPPGQSVILYDALVEAGVEAELVILPNKHHEFLGTNAVSRARSFFDRHLKAGSAPAREPVVDGAELRPLGPA